MKVKQRLSGADTLQKLTSEWICPSCLLRRARKPLSRQVSRHDTKSLSTSSKRRENEHMTQGYTTETSSTPETTNSLPFLRKVPPGLTRHISGRSDPDVVFSLVQPTGVPHLGNYLGAIRAWKEIEQAQSLSNSADRKELFFGLADLHSLTSNQSSQQRRQAVKETFAALLALGLGTSKGQEKNLFVQSQVPQHAELMWILSTITSTGNLSRMVQWKDKSGISSETSSDDNHDIPTRRESPERLKLGLFSYPVLQAADILLYHAAEVPVGEDQIQHVELTRTLARSFNRTFNKVVFREPRLVISPAKRIMSLQNPTKKMSKSDPDVMSRILVTDEPRMIFEKVKKAKTDSIEGLTYDPEKRPGVANLIDILRYVTKSDLSGEEVAKDHATTRLYNFKMMIADAIVKELEGVGEKFEELMVQDDYLKDKMRFGSGRARRRASATLTEVREVVGLDYGTKRVSAEHYYKASADEE